MAFKRAVNFGLKVPQKYTGGAQKNTGMALKLLVPQHVHHLTHLRGDTHQDKWQPAKRPAGTETMHKQTACITSNTSTASPRLLRIFFRAKPVVAVLCK